MRPSSHESPDFCSSQDSLAFLNFVSTIMASALRETGTLIFPRTEGSLSEDSGMQVLPPFASVSFETERDRPTIHPCEDDDDVLRPSVASPFRIGCFYFLHSSCRIGIISVPGNDNLRSRSGAPHIVSQSGGGGGGRRYFHPLGICTESEKVYLT